MQNINALIEPIEIKSRVYLNRMNDARIDNEADKENACVLLKEISDYAKAIETQRKELTKPLKAEVKEIEDKFKAPLQFLKEADTILRDKINHFLNEQRAKREAEALARKQLAEDEALKQAEQLESLKAGAGDFDAVTRKAMIDAIEEKQNKIIDETAKKETINQSSANSIVRSVWSFRLVDLKKVPAQYLQLNETAIRQAIKNGERHIDGLEIFQQSQVAIR